MWAKSAEFMSILANINEYLFQEIQDPCAFISYCRKALIIIIFPSLRQDSLFFSGEFNEMIDSLYVAVIDKIMEEGHSIPYPEGYYHAEAYLKENVPTAGVVSKMAYLFLCNKS